jgi:hypothetical protein
MRVAAALITVVKSFNPFTEKFTSFLFLFVLIEPQPKNSCVFPCNNKGKSRK